MKEDIAIELGKILEAVSRIDQRHEKIEKNLEQFTTIQRNQETLVIQQGKDISHHWYHIVAIWAVIGGVITTVITLFCNHIIGGK